jgi:spermidine synthase
MLGFYPLAAEGGLTPSELGRIWDTLEAGPCKVSLSSPIKQLIFLFKAISSRDAYKMSATAKVLLERTNKMTPNTMKYLVATAMLGSISQGDYTGANILWSRDKTAMFGNDEPDLLFRLLANESTNHL